MPDAKELIKACTRILNQEQHIETEGNMAHSPVILLFFGDIVNSHMQHVKNTLDANFKNGEFLQYLHVAIGSDDCCIKNIFNQKTYGDIDEAIHDASLILLGTENAVFPSKKEIYFECLLSSNETYAQEYYEMFMQLKESHNYNLIKTLYLMIDQESRANENKAQNLIKWICEKEGSAVRDTNIYLFSNLLHDGSILREDRIWQNYRLVADLILLGNTADSSVSAEGGGIRSYPGIVHDGVMTAAYSFIGKPLDDIAKISLYYLMKRLYEHEEALAYEINPQELSILLREKLDVKESGIERISELFQAGMLRNLPDAEAYQWLPWKDFKSYKRFRKKKITDWQEVNEMTFGVLELYFSNQYDKFLEEEINKGPFEDECRKDIRDFLLSRFSFFEMIQILRNEQWKEALHGINVSIDFDGNYGWEELMKRQSEKRLEKKFHIWAIGILEDEMQRLYDHVIRIQKEYLDALEQVRKATVSFEKKNDQMEKFYENEVDQFLLSGDYLSFKRENLLFRADQTIDQILSRIYEIFVNLIREHSVYREPFEKEEEQRMKDVSAPERSRIIRNRLSADVSSRGRLRLNYGYRENRTGAFCLINSKSVYINELKDDERRGQFILFNLNRRDCLEMIELYRLEALDQIILKN